MQPEMSSVPSPATPPPQPGPSVVPPKVRPARPRRTRRWSVLIALVLVAAGAAYYFKSQADAKAAAKGAGVVVSTLVLGTGDVTSTVRVSGSVSAQNFAALLAPRIVGSRSGFNRG